MKELGPRIQSVLPATAGAQGDRLPRSDSYFRPPPPEAPGLRCAELLARRRERVGGWCGGVAAGWGSRPAGCAGSQSEEEGALATLRGRDRAASSSEQLPGHLGFWGGGAQETVNMDPVAGAFLRMLALLSAQPWSTLAAGNTCEYSKSFKTYTNDIEFRGVCVFNN